MKKINALKPSVQRQETEDSVWREPQGVRKKLLSSLKFFEVEQRASKKDVQVRTYKRPLKMSLQKDTRRRTQSFSFGWYFLFNL